jgi:hypothetical protein
MNYTNPKLELLKIKMGFYLVTSTIMCNFVAITYNIITMSREVFYRMMMAAALLATSACGHNKSTTDGTATADSTHNATAEFQNGLELPLPEVPVSITEPKDRAAFVLYHFWDALDFNDTVRSHNRDLLEQNFANYLTLFSVADTSEVIRAIDKLTAAARVDSVAYQQVQKVAEKYLYDPNSPMLNEDYYALFAHSFLRDAALDMSAREQFKFQLSCIAKNRCGARATDFAYVDRNGRKGTLMGTPFQGKLMVIFYDPDCDECKASIAEWGQSNALNELIASQRVTVLAVCTEGEKSAWQQHLVEMPTNWLVTYDASGINEKNLYILRAMPTIYIIGEDHRIVGKDVLPTQVLQVLE